MANNQYPYQSTPGFYSNMLNYAPGGGGMMGMIQNLAKQFLFPNAENVAPIGMSQFDMNRIMEETRRRSDMQKQYQASNPAAISIASSMLSRMGVQNASSYFFQQGGGLSSTGKIVSDLFSTFIQASPYESLGQQRNYLRDAFKGNMFDLGSARRTDLGLSDSQTANIIRDLSRNVYTDSLMTRKRGIFNIEDMVDISRIGKDYGLFQGVRSTGIADRTIGLSKNIQSAMNVFGTQDKEEAVRNIIEITGDTTAFSDPSTLQRTLENVKNMARSTNMSVALMKEVLMRGQELAKSLDLQGSTGTAITTITTQNASIALDQMNPNIAKKANRTTFIDAANMLNARFAGSARGTSIFNTYGAATALGIDTTNFVKGFDKGIPTEGAVSNLLEQIQKTLMLKIKQENPGISDAKAEQIMLGRRDALMQQNRALAEKDLGGKMAVAPALYSFQEFLADDRFSKYRKMVESGNIDDIETLKLDYKGFLYPFLDQFGITDRGVKEQMAEMFFNQVNPDKDMKRQNIAFKEQQERDTIRERFLERIREDSTGGDRLLDTLARGGTLKQTLRAFLWQNVDKKGFRAVNDNAEYNKLFENLNAVSGFISDPYSDIKIAGGNEILGNQIFTPEELQDILNTKAGTLTAKEEIALQQAQKEAGTELTFNKAREVLSKMGVDWSATKNKALRYRYNAVSTAEETAGKLRGLTDDKYKTEFLEDIFAETPLTELEKTATKDAKDYQEALKILGGDKKKAMAWVNSILPGSSPIDINDYKELLNYAGKGNESRILDYFMASNPILKKLTAKDNIEEFFKKNNLTPTDDFLAIAKDHQKRLIEETENTKKNAEDESKRYELDLAEAKRKMTVMAIGDNENLQKYKVENEAVSKAMDTEVGKISSLMDEKAYALNKGMFGETYAALQEAEKRGIQLESRDQLAAFSQGLNKKFNVQGATFKKYKISKTDDDSKLIFNTLAERIESGELSTEDVLKSLQTGDVGSLLRKDDSYLKEKVRNITEKDKSGELKETILAKLANQISGQGLNKLQETGDQTNSILAELKGLLESIKDKFVSENFTVKVK